MIEFMNIVGGVMVGVIAAAIIAHWVVLIVGWTVHIDMVRTYYRRNYGWETEATAYLIKRLFDAHEWIIEMEFPESFFAPYYPYPFDRNRIHAECIYIDGKLYYLGLFEYIKFRRWRDKIIENSKYGLIENVTLED